MLPLVDCVNRFVWSVTFFVLFVACNHNQQRCDSGECVYISYWCDGDADCYDASDEIGCGE